MGDDGTRLDDTAWVLAQGKGLEHIFDVCVARAALRHVPSLLVGVPATPRDRQQSWFLIQALRIALRCSIGHSERPALRLPVSPEFTQLGQENSAVAFKAAHDLLEARNKNNSDVAFGWLFGILSDEFAERYLEYFALDLQLGMAGEFAFNRPLFHEDEHPLGGSEAIKGEGDWRFWKRWYEGFMVGKPMNLPLLREIDAIPVESWDKGSGHVANVIAGIEARMKTAVATPLVRDPDASAFVLQEEPPLPSETLEFIKERVGGALRTAVDSGGSNGFDEACPEALAVTKALESVNPSAVASLLNDASLMFQKNLGDRYPEDGALIVLQSACFASAEEICETDEVARARCLRASKLFLKEHPEPIDPAELVEFSDEVASEAEGEARDIIIESGRDISRGKSVGRFIRARYAHYVATIVDWIDKTKEGAGRVEWLWKMVRRVMDMFDDGPPPP